jgi:hypothetical protein
VSERFLLLLAFTAVSVANAQPTKSPAEVITSFVEAINKGNAKGLSELFVKDNPEITDDRGIVIGKGARTPDLVFDPDKGVYITPGTEGQAAIERLFVKILSKPTRREGVSFYGAKLELLTEPRVRLIGTTASVDIAWQQRGSRDSDGLTIPKRSGWVNFLLTKQNGVWLIVVMQAQGFLDPQISQMQMIPLGR